MFETRTAKTRRLDNAMSGVRIAILALAAAVGVFLLQNAQSIEVRFLWFDWDAPAMLAYAAIALTSFALGAAAWALGAQRRTQ